MREFEAARPQLMAVAFRLLGSVHDAEDAVQSSWIKAASADSDSLRNPAAWLTTVVSRVCLDRLRMRARRHEEPLRADELPAEELTADERYLRRERVSRALMVVLDALTPAQRVAYVLHDLFDVPFRDVARILAISPDSAKKHASRARTRVESTDPAAHRAAAVDTAVVEAFLAAAAGGDIDRMIALMADDCVRIADGTLLPSGAPAVVRGARAVAEETTQFAERIRVSTWMLVNECQAHVIAPGGHPLAIINIAMRSNQVSQVTVTRVTAQTTFALLSTTS
ncbi:sigma-70 family RNA polymerase sigma factor [Streptomyces sp. A0642]|nr:sigma-70 family RNA polymerase sigma factor [Streptomyces sp. A0642]